MDTALTLQDPGEWILGKPVLPCRQWLTKRTLPALKTTHTCSSRQNFLSSSSPWSLARSWESRCQVGQMPTYQ